MIDSLFGNLKITTLRKLPINAPRIKNNIINGQIELFQNEKLGDKLRLQ